jgi:hypothetical protein
LSEHTPVAAITFSNDPRRDPPFAQPTHQTKRIATRDNRYRAMTTGQTYNIVEPQRHCCDPSDRPTTTVDPIEEHEHEQPVIHRRDPRDRTRAGAQPAGDASADPAITR